MNFLLLNTFLCDKPLKFGGPYRPTPGGVRLRLEVVLVLPAGEDVQVLLVELLEHLLLLAPHRHVAAPVQQQQ